MHVAEDMQGLAEVVVERGVRVGERGHPDHIGGVLGLEVQRILRGARPVGDGQSEHISLLLKDRAARRSTR